MKQWYALYVFLYSYEEPYGYKHSTEFFQLLSDQNFGFKIHDMSSNNHHC